MIYLILVGLYAYLVIKASLRYFVNENKLRFFQDYRLNLVEVLLFALIIAYIFNFYYFQENEFRDFIVSRSLLWVAFIASTLMLGIGIGIRFAIDTLHRLIPHESKEVFTESKRVHDIYSQVWINVSVIFLFFIYCIMEISKPSDTVLPMIEVIVIYMLAIIYGVLYSIMHHTDHKLIKQVNMVGLGLIGLCLLSFIYELNVNFLTALPITISFVLFIFTFLLINAVKLLKHRFVYTGEAVMDFKTASPELHTPIEEIQKVIDSPELVQIEQTPVSVIPDIKPMVFSLSSLKKPQV